MVRKSTSGEVTFKLKAKREVGSNLGERMGTNSLGKSSETWRNMVIEELKEVQGSRIGDSKRWE